MKLVDLWIKQNTQHSLKHWEHVEERLQKSIKKYVTISLICIAKYQLQLQCFLQWRNLSSRKTLTAMLIAESLVRGRGIRWWNMRKENKNIDCTILIDIISIKYIQTVCHRYVMIRGLYCAPPVPIGTSWNRLDSDQKFESREPAKLVGNFSNFSDWILLSSSDSDRFHRKESDQIPIGTKWNQSGIWLEIDIIY